MFLPALENNASQGGAVGFTLQFRLGSVAPAVQDVEAALVWIRRHAKEPGRRSPTHHPCPISPVNGLAAPVPSEQSRRLSPLFHVDAQTPPVLTLHGQKHYGGAPS